MSLTSSDLQNIENISDVNGDSIASDLDERLVTLYGDLLEIRQQITQWDKNRSNVEEICKSSLDEKIVESYKEILSIAKQAGVTLPRN
jgi:hypothetical protein